MDGSFYTRATMLGAAFVGVMAVWMEWQRRKGPSELREADEAQARADRERKLSPEYIAEKEKERLEYRYRVIYTTGERKRISGANGR